MNNILNLKTSSDSLGIWSSTLCAIHCTITPLIFIAKPLLEQGAKSSFTSMAWGLFDYIFLIISFVAVLYSTKHTINKKLSIGMWVAWIALFIGIILEGFEVSYGGILMYCGSFSLIALHYYNRKYCTVDGCKVDH